MKQPFVYMRLQSMLLQDASDAPVPVLTNRDKRAGNLSKDADGKYYGTVHIDAIENLNLTREEFIEWVSKNAGIWYDGWVKVYGSERPTQLNQHGPEQ